jgi:hypothetical protein
MLTAGVAGCGDSKESLASCIEQETGYEVVHRSAKLSCAEARSVLALLGAANHGVQIVREGAAEWKCQAFPGHPGRLKYRCQLGAQHFDVVRSDG